MIEIVAPRAEWPRDFASLKAAITRAVPTLTAIHHIGSTAVAGLVAKDVIDIQVTVDDLSTVDVGAFERAGFLPRPIFTDHCPPGLDLPAEELAKRFFKSAGRPANLHVRERGRFNQRYALLCRDFLRSHPRAAAAYGVVKQQLAARFADDADAYYDIKDPVFDIIMAGAEEWASRTGWSVPSGD